MPDQVKWFKDFLDEVCRDTTDDLIASALLENHIIETEREIERLRDKRLKEFARCKRQHSKIQRALKSLKTKKTSEWSTSGSSGPGGKTT